MTKEEQKRMRDEVLLDIYDWDKDILGLQTPTERKYEHETGKSCVFWQSEGKVSKGEDLDWHDTLPRAEDYITDGNTEEYERWVSMLVDRVVAEGANTREAVAEKIKEICEVRQ